MQLRPTCGVARWKRAVKSLKTSVGAAEQQPESEPAAPVSGGSASAEKKVTIDMDEL